MNNTYNTQPQSTQKYIALLAHFQRKREHLLSLFTKSAKVQSVKNRCQEIGNN